MRERIRGHQTKNDFSEKLAGIADDEIMSILNNNYKRAKDVLSENIEILHEMAKLLLARETIYKEEVDMVLAGKKTEEIVKIMEEKEKQQKEKEAKIRAEKEKFNKLESFRKKIAEGERLVKMGIITEAELDNLKKEFLEFEKSLNQTQEDSAKTEKEPKKVENKEKKEDEKVDENKEKTVKRTTTRKTTTKKPTEEVEKKEEKDNKNDEEG